MQKFLHAKSTRIPKRKNGRGPWSSLSSPSRIRISCGQCTVSTLDTSCPQFLQMARALMVWQNRLPQGWDTGILVNWDKESKKCNEYAMTQIQGTQEIPRKPKKSQESFAAVYSVHLFKFADGDAEHSRPCYTCHHPASMPTVQRQRLVQGFGSLAGLPETGHQSKRFFLNVCRVWEQKVPKCHLKCHQYSPMHHDSHIFSYLIDCE